MLEEKITDLINPLLKAEGLEIVKVNVTSNSKGKVLQILLEQENGDTAKIAECEKASRNISALLDVENVFSDKYFLEVSSAGLERPLVKPKDFERYEGFLIKAKLKLLDSKHNTKKFKGRIKTSDDASFEIFDDEKGEDIKIDYFNLDDAKLVVTDEMFKSKGLRN